MIATPLKVRPVDDKPLDDYFPTRYMKPADFIRWKVAEIAATIVLAQEEEVQPKPGQPEWKLVLYFQKKGAQPGAPAEKCYLISAKADRDALKAATGAERVKDLVGKRITVRMATYRGVAVLRIDPTPCASES